MKVIHKYPVSNGAFVVLMPEHVLPLCIRVQNGDPFMWAVVFDTDEPLVPRWFYTAMTGAELPERLNHYIGTFQLNNGIVGHVFDLPGEPQ